MDPRLLALLGPAATAALGGLAWLFKRGLILRLDEIASDVKEVKKDVSDHATRLARVEVRVEDLTKRLDRSDDRRGIA